MQQSDQAKLLSKFFSDPDWTIVEGIIKEYIEPLRDVLLIDATKDAETVRAEVIAKQTSYNQLTRFMTESGMLKRVIEKEKQSFK